MKKNGEIFLFSEQIKNTKFVKRNNFNKIKLIDENKIKYFLKNLNLKRLFLDRLSCSIAYENIIKNFNISNKNDPIYNMKSIKNNIEIKKFIKSHIFDGVAVIKFLYWIKKL